MTPFLSAVASLALAVAIVVAFAAWLRHCVGRRPGVAGTSAAPGSGTLACEATHCDTGGD